MEEKRNNDKMILKLKKERERLLEESNVATILLNKVRDAAKGIAKEDYWIKVKELLKVSIYYYADRKEYKVFFASKSYETKNLDGIEEIREAIKCIREAGYGVEPTESKGQGFLEGYQITM